MEKNFTGYSVKAIRFLNELKENNNREWFSENKKTFEQEIKAPADIFSRHMADELERLTGLIHQVKIFRIYRDIRFSKDKTPYNAHLHISFKPITDTPYMPFWFFALETDCVKLGVGRFSFEKQELIDYRARIDSSDGNKLSKIISRLSGNNLHINEPALKRVPSNFAKDHKHEGLLRHKGLTAFYSFPDTSVAIENNAVEKCMEGFKQIKPFYDWLTER